MSNPCPASENTSPVSSVRSSGAPTADGNVSSATPSTKPTAITPPVLAQRNGSGLSSQSMKGNDDFKKPFPYQAGVHNGIHDYEGSDPNTPRLPPTMNGSNDLDSIPQEAAERLDSTAECSKATHPLSEDYSKHQFPLSRAPTGTFSSSVSEPGSRSPDTLYRAPHESPHITHRQDRCYIGSWLEDSHRIYAAPSTIQPAPPLRTPRTKSHGMLSDSQLSGTRDQEAVQSVNGMDSERPLRAREEANSERRNRSSSRSSQSRVEKQIQATLAEADRSSHARSRKSSHTFGLFKENNTSQGTRIAQDRSRTASDNSIDVSRSSSNLLDDDLKRIGHSPKSILNDTRGKDGALGNTEEPLQTLLGKGDEQSEHDEVAHGYQQSSRPSSSRSTRGSMNNSLSDTDVVIDASKGGAESRPEKAADSSKRKVPTRLLEEIRDYHNLSAPFHEQFRSTQPKATRASNPSAEAETPSEYRKDGLGEESHDELLKTTEGHDNEDDESEHISSALYYPHQAPSPDALEDVSIGDARKVKDVQIDADTLLPEPALSPDDDDKRTSEDVDIALQVHNENRYLHGDLQKARPLSTDPEAKQGIEGGFSSASESEYESLDEAARPIVGEDCSLTDDAEATPRASPNSRKSYLLSRSRKAHRAPAAPLGAVELKPYNHQVGGHTTVFRFSKRAVCKQLSNRENEFYEVVERQHPDLLKFLPRYA
jgi:inositol-hexakisphosphate kinase